MFILFSQNYLTNSKDFRMSTKNTKTSIGTRLKTVSKPKSQEIAHPLWANISKSSDFDQIWENIVNDSTKDIKLSSEGEELLQKISNPDLPDSDDQD